MKRLITKVILIVCGCTTAALAIFGLAYLAEEYSTPRTYEASVIRYGFAYGVDANLIFAVIKAESGFNPRAVSRKGAEGLMQLTAPTAFAVADALGDNPEGVNLFDPDLNIRYGTYYLSYLIGKFKSADLAIVAYNAGEGTLRRWMRDGMTAEDLSGIPYPETAAYYAKVKRYYEWYRHRYSY